MTKTSPIPEFALSDFSSADTSTMTVIVGGKPSDWTWTFAGPGHENSVALNKQTTRELLHAERAKEMARANGKKWKAPEEDVDDIRNRNIRNVAARLLAWSQVRIGGEDYPCTQENVIKLLSPPENIGLLTQALEFLSDEASFTPRSAQS